MSSQGSICPTMPTPVHEQFVLPFLESHQPPPANDELPAPPVPIKRRKSATPNPATALADRPETLADLLALLKADHSTHRDHAQAKSAVVQIGKVLRRPLCDIPTNPEALRPLLTAAAPAAYPMTQARWSRCIGLTMKALKPYYPDLMARRRVAGLSPHWKVWGGELPTKQLRNGLCRFMGHCTEIGTDPDAVTLETFENYREALIKRSLQSSPNHAYRLAISLWNKAVADRSGWEERTVPLETSAHFYSLDWKQFPSSFVADVEEFLSHERAQDIFSDNFRRQPKESTIVAWRRHIRQVASLLAGTGFPTENIISLAVLIENANPALKAQQIRKGGNSVILAGQAATLALIARYWVKDPKRAKDLRDIANRACPKRNGMTDKNKSRLRQFDLRENKLALLRLPERVFAELARSDQGSVEEARRAMYALAVAILIVAPMRAHNLVGLEQNRHFLMLGRGAKQVRVLVIPGVETKTGEDFEMRLAEAECRLVDTYLTTFRPRVCSSVSPYLFPNPAGDRRGVTAFSKSVCDFIRRETGFIMHIHLFRQLAGKLHLDENPSDIETVRRILRHRSSETTIRYYAEQNNAHAFESYGQSLAKLKSDPVNLILQRPVAGCRKRLAKTKVDRPRAEPQAAAQLQAGGQA
jgi:integrase